ncbi:N-acetylglucosaminyltransferase [Photobacterium profundum]|uniref:N-acetylglucosaminyltransferase n=1 Tax=Photobacterium profundum 3TCK TaxID=314280 RepID=Q1Z0I7_9GAMM|nr:hypothetical protein P3TCK_11759 [Photobacterium profundum 3TCK]PSV61934.1 N-acetylglucosaminyltransferase [Photobacterium profundum]
MIMDSFQLTSITLTLLKEHSILWLQLIPMLIVVELPLSLLVLTGIFRWAYHQPTPLPTHYPSLSFMIVCYGEGDAITVSIDTLVEQIYPGNIEILVIVDGASQNQHTYHAAIRAKKKHKKRRLRTIRVLPKWQRGGRVSSCNAGLSQAKNDIVFAIDGDTSFDNNMAIEMVNNFTDPNIIGSGGTLRVRNWRTNFITRMQALEYMMSIQAGKTGMAAWGVLNNISGAFGAFRKDALRQVGGWDTHTAEDLDLTMRLKQYKKRYPKSDVAFSPLAVGHTDVPDTLKGIVMQRLRWDGDLLFIFFRKHRQGLTPRLLGWGNFLFILVYGILQNILMPLLIFGYTLFLFAQYPLTFVFAILLTLYFVYMVMIIIHFVVFIGLVSERKYADTTLIGWLPFYPFFAFFMRLVTAFSMINELVRRSHEESGMAPWWVLKRGKKF